MVAKAVAIEYLPVVSSASLATILARLAWKRLPAWIKEDASFRKSTESKDMEGLSSVLEKIQGWIEESSKQLQSPVPHLYASFLVYWQLVAQQQRQKLEQQASYPSSRNDVMVDDSINDNVVVDFATLEEMLALATLAYYLDDATDLQEKLETLHYELKTLVLPTRPGSVGYYVAVNQEEELTEEASSQKRKTLIIGVRGTSTLEELLTDACGRAVSYHGPDSFGEDADEGTSNNIRIEVSARGQDEVYCSSEYNETNEELDVEIVSGHERVWIEQDGEQNNDGDDNAAVENHVAGRHSLRRRSTLDSQIRCHEGILASAKRLFVQVRPIIEEKVVRGDHRLVLVGHSLGASAACLLAMILRSRYPELVHSDRLHVYAFGPPPVLDHDSAIGASSYVTSVVHQSDLIARCSLANLAVFLEFLRMVSSDILTAQGLAPTGPRTTAALLQQLSKGDTGESFWSEEELNDAMAKAQEKVEVRDPDHLYVPGKVHFLESTGDTRPQQSLENPSDMEATRYLCNLTDGTTPSLRVIEMNGYRMLGDHTTASYLAAIAAFASQ